MNLYEFLFSSFAAFGAVVVYVSFLSSLRSEWVRYWKSHPVYGYLTYCFHCLGFWFFIVFYLTPWNWLEAVFVVYGVSVLIDAAIKAVQRKVEENL